MGAVARVRGALGDRLAGLGLYQVVRRDTLYVIDFVGNGSTVLRVTVDRNDTNSTNLATRLKIENISVTDIAL